MRRIFECLLWSAMCGVVCLSFSQSASAFEIPSFAEVMASHTSSDALLLDRNGEPLADVRIDQHVHRLEWVRLDELSASMRETLLVAEDKRFYEHNGVDWRAFIGALWHNLWNSTKRGASTLTMQLAGMLDPALRLPKQGMGRRSFEQKWDQSLAAQQLEERWSKSQILEAYLNLAPFRGDIEGIGAASQFILHKAPSQLTRSEAAILAVLLRGPNARRNVVAQRACHLVQRLKAGKLCAQVEILTAQYLDAPRNQPLYTLAPHLARQVLQTAGQKTRVTIDADIQKRLLEFFRAQTIASPIADAQLGALVVDASKGEVKAWLGGLDSRSPDRVKFEYPMLEASWPSIYASAIERRVVTAATLVRLVPEREAWHSVRYALAGHYAEPVKQLNQLLSSEYTAAPLAALEVHSASDQDINVLPQNGNLLQLVQGWRSYAGDGLSVEPTIQLNAEPRVKRMFSTATTAIVRSILRDKTSPLTPAIAEPDSLPNWLIHSADDRDVMVVGGDSKQIFALLLSVPKTSVRSADLMAQALWNEAARLLELQSETIRITPQLVRNLVAFNPPVEVARKEWFLKGTEISLAKAEELAPLGQRISYPANSRIYTVAADAAQRLPWVLSADGAGRAKWRLDAVLIGEGARFKWSPELGKHKLELLNAKDEPIDVIEFEVQPSKPDTLPSHNTQ